MLKKYARLVRYMVSKGYPEQQALQDIVTTFYLPPEEITALRQLIEHGRRTAA